MLGVMRHGLFILLWLCPVSVLANEVYKTVDEHGNIIFSDEPAEGAEKIEIREPQRIQPLSDGNFKYTPPPVVAEAYEAVEITSPKNDQAIRENAGNIAVSVKIEPGLLPGHKIYLYLDGQEKQSGAATSFNLNNLDRGSHTLRAVVKDSGERTMKSSATIVFHILRHSVLHKNAPARQNTAHRNTAGVPPAR